MILMRNIIREGNKILRQTAKDVTLPFSNEDKKTLIDMLTYLANSQDEEMAAKYRLRPGVGLAAPQVNVSKRMLVILTKGTDGKPLVLPMVNPVILSHSEAVIYLPDGEGCLSVDRVTEGVTPRYREITIKSHIFNLATGTLEEKTMKLSNFLSIVFQHEYDHLDGILFTDKLFNELPNAQPFIAEEDENDAN